MEKYCFAIVYEDAAGNSSQISVPFGDKYCQTTDYRENFEDAATIVMEDGCFWVGEKYLIPSHRIIAFVPTPPKSKPEPKSEPKPEPKTSKGKIEFIDGEESNNKENKGSKGRKKKAHYKRRGNKKKEGNRC